MLQDAYLDVRFTPKLRFRAGKIKTPFGIERLQSAPEPPLRRARPAQQPRAQPRRRACRSTASWARARFGYQLAVLNGVPDGGSVDTRHERRQGPRRPRLPPALADEAAPRPCAASASASRAPRARPRARCADTARSPRCSVFSYATHRHRERRPHALVAAGLRFFLGPVGLLAEYVAGHARRPERRDRQAHDHRPSSTNSAWSVTGSCLLTGEDATYADVKPKNFFVPSAGKWGALQLVARVNRLDVDDATFSGGFADATRSVRQASGLGRGRELDLEQQPQVRARLRADALQGRRGQRRRPPHREERPDPPSALLLISDRGYRMKTHVAYSARSCGRPGVAGGAGAARLPSSC